MEYVRLIQWAEEKPFESPIDGDDPNHINWIYEKAVERAAQFGKLYNLAQFRTFFQFT